MFKRLWLKYSDIVVQSYIVKWLLTNLLYLYLRLVYLTNPLISQSENPKKIHDQYNPFIITFWHGRHIMGPFLRPKEEQIAAMFSRSKDAELNALVGQKLGLEIVRGSGGRDKSQARDKGGARALLALRNYLKKKINVSMIADISNKAPREAGSGIILLAKISGRPIIPYIYAFSREKILQNSWDKTAIPLPFGRSVFLSGPAFFVPADSSAEKLESIRLELTQIMNSLTENAYKLLHGDIDVRAFM